MQKKALEIQDCDGGEPSFRQLLKAIIARRQGPAAVDKDLPKKKKKKKKKIKSEPAPDEGKGVWPWLQQPEPDEQCANVDDDFPKIKNIKSEPASDGIDDLPIFELNLHKKKTYGKADCEKKPVKSKIKKGHSKQLFKRLSSGPVVLCCIA